MTFSQRAAKIVREFIRTATPDELIALAERAAPDLFPAKPAESESESASMPSNNDGNGQAK